MEAEQGLETDLTECGRGWGARSLTSGPAQAPPHLASENCRVLREDRKVCFPGPHSETDVCLTVSYNVLLSGTSEGAPRTPSHSQTSGTARGPVKMAKQGRSPVLETEEMAMKQ